MKKILAFIAALCIACACVASAATTLPKPTDAFYVYDGSKVLSEQTEQVIIANNEALEKACGAQIVIMTVPTTGDLSSQEYSYRILNEWGVGDKKEDNGFVLVMATSDYGCYLTEGTGAERIIASADITDMLYKYLKPYYDVEDYDSASLALFEQLFLRVRDFYGVNLAYQNADAIYRSNGADYPPYEGRTNDSEEGWTMKTTLGLIVFLIILYLIIGRGRRRSAVRRGVPYRPIFIRPRAPRPPRPPRPFYSAPRPPRPPMGGFGAPRGGGFSSSSSRSTGSRPTGGFGGGRSSGGGRHVGGGGSSRGSGGGFGR